MIDDQTKVAELMDKMQAHVPIPAKPTGQLVRTLRGKGLKINTDRPLFIKRVFYLGDEGGIACDVTPARGAKEAYVVSLTHLRLAPRHPLFQDIREYQRERVKQLIESG